MKKLLKVELYDFFHSAYKYMTIILFLMLPLPFILTGFSSNWTQSIDVGIASLQMTPIFIIIAAMIPALIQCMDFQRGTIRNKVIVGNSRSNIMISKTLFSIMYCLVCTVILLAFYFILSLILPKPEITIGTDVVVSTMLLHVLNVVALVSFNVAFLFITRRQEVIAGIIIIPEILLMVPNMLMEMGNTQAAKIIGYIFPFAGISSGTAYTMDINGIPTGIENVWIYILISVLYTMLWLVVGYKIFQKGNLK